MNFRIANRTKYDAIFESFYLLNQGRVKKSIIIYMQTDNDHSKDS